MTVSYTHLDVYKRQALQSAQRQGLPNVAVTQNPNQYMSQECGVHVDMMCADEEYKMRTVGYVSGMVVQLLIAMEIGLRRHTITAEEEQKLIAQIEAALTNWPQIETQAMTWYKRNETQLLNSAMFAVYGIDGLWGAALEGALKLIEIGKVMSIGYELEEGMHGPTLGFHPQLCVLVMNDGGRENDRARGLARFAKCEFGNGFLIGANPVSYTHLDVYKRQSWAVISWCASCTAHGFPSRLVLSPRF